MKPLAHWIKANFRLKNSNSYHWIYSRLWFMWHYLSPKVKAMAKKKSAFQSCLHQICIHIQGLAFLLWLVHTTSPPTQKGMPTIDQLTPNSAVDSLDTITTLMYNHLYHFLVWTHPWGTGEICCSGPRQLQLS